MALIVEDKDDILSFIDRDDHVGMQARLNFGIGQAFMDALGQEIKRDLSVGDISCGLAGFFVAIVDNFMRAVPEELREETRVLILERFAEALRRSNPQ